MKITLTPDIESALIEEANRKNTTPETLALDCLRNQFASPKEDGISEADGRSLADFLAGHIGVLASGDHIPGGASLSEQSGQKFTDALMKKRKQGRL